MDLQHFAEKIKKRQPDFTQFERVLRNQRPSRPVLFEMGPNVNAATQLPGYDWLPDHEPLAPQRNFMDSHRWLGYDYAILPYWGYRLSRGGPNRSQSRAKDAHLHTHSLNAGAGLVDWPSFEAYPWPEWDEAEFDRMAELAPYIPEGMRLVLRSLGSVQEQMINLVGYENLCLLIYDEPDLVRAISDRVGRLAVDFFTLALRHDFIGACLISDDWGFKTQTLMPPDFLHRYVIPWHKKVVETVHAAGRPMILHSCGQIEAVMEAVIEECHFDAKHSFEDAALPVDRFYRQWGPRIAVLGGMDVDFLCRKTPAEVRQRGLDLLDMASDRGGYALGSGNSIPSYVPIENYFALNGAAIF